MLASFREQVSGNRETVTICRVAVPARAVEDRAANRVGVRGRVIEGISATSRVTEDEPAGDIELRADGLEVVDEQRNIDWSALRQRIRAQHPTLIDADDADALVDEPIRDGCHEVPAALAGAAVDIEQRYAIRGTAIVDEHLSSVDLQMLHAAHLPCLREVDVRR